MKTTTTKLFLSLAISSLVIGLILAGTLDPPAPPAPSLVTLQQIYDRVGMILGVHSTGQTECWNVSGTPIGCAGTGQDGALHKGASVSPRFTEDGNGAVRDNLTGLIWLKHASCFGAQSWANALSSANTLASGACGLTDGSVAGNWRLPNLRELQSLIDYSRSGPALPVGHPFTGVAGGNYWSSTSFSSLPIDAWRVLINEGFVSYVDKNSSLDVWPVRGGQ